MPDYQYPYSAFVTGVLDTNSFRAELIAMLRRDPSAAEATVDQLTIMYRKHNLPEETFTDLRRYAETVAAKQAFADPVILNQRESSQKMPAAHSQSTHAKAPYTKAPSTNPTPAIQTQSRRNKIRDEYADSGPASENATELRTPEASEEVTFLRSVSVSTDDGDATLIRSADTPIEQTDAMSQAIKPLNSTAGAGVTGQPIEKGSAIERQKRSQSGIDNNLDENEKFNDNLATGQRNRQIADNPSSSRISTENDSLETDPYSENPSKFNARNIVGVIVIVAVMSIVYIVSPSDVETVGIPTPVDYISPKASTSTSEDIVPAETPAKSEPEQSSDEPHNAAEASLEERLRKFSQRTKDLSNKRNESIGIKDSSQAESTSTLSNMETIATDDIASDGINNAITIDRNSTPSLTIAQLHQRALARARTLQIEPSSDPDSATGYLKKMIEKDKGNPLIRETRAEIARAYLALAKQARLEGDWDRVDILVEKAITVRMENSVIN